MINEKQEKIISQIEELTLLKEGYTKDQIIEILKIESNKELAYYLRRLVQNG